MIKAGCSVRSGRRHDVLMLSLRGRRLERQSSQRQLPKYLGWDAVGLPKRGVEKQQVLSQSLVVA
jgi:hypothetical protein